MAGFWVVMLPFIFAGIAAVTVTAIIVGVLALDYGISIAVIMNAERKRQKKYGKKPIVQTFLMIYGILLASIPTSFAAYAAIRSEDFLDAVGLIFSLALPFLGVTLPLGTASIVLFQVFMVVAGISLVFIGRAERKRLAKRGEKRVIHILMIIYGIVIAAIPICTALFLGGMSWLLGLLTEQTAVFMF